MSGGAASVCTLTSIACDLTDAPISLTARIVIVLYSVVCVSPPTVAVQPPTHAEVLSQSEEDGVITRVTSMTPVTNPVPYSLRSMLGCKDGFTFKITEQWRRDRHDEAGAMTFVTEPPVMRDRICVSGKQWVEAHGAGCRLFFELHVTCRVKGVGRMVSKGIVDGSLASYAQLPTLAIEYAALRRAASDAAEAYDRASRLSHANPNDDDDDDETAADAGADADAARARREEDARPDVDATPRSRRGGVHRRGDIAGADAAVAAIPSSRRGVQVSEDGWREVSWHRSDFLFQEAATAARRRDARRRA